MANAIREPLLTGMSRPTIVLITHAPRRPTQITRTIPLGQDGRHDTRGVNLPWLTLFPLPPRARSLTMRTRQDPEPSSIRGKVIHSFFYSRTLTPFRLILDPRWPARGLASDMPTSASCLCRHR